LDHGQFGPGSNRCGTGRLSRAEHGRDRPLSRHADDRNLHWCDDRDTRRNPGHAIDGARLSEVCSGYPTGQSANRLERTRSRNRSELRRVRTDMRDIPEILAAFAVFGLFFICPLVFMLTKHQRAMAQIFHAGASNDALRRIEMLEREVQELRATRHDPVLWQEDQRELSRRITP